MRYRFISRESRHTSHTDTLACLDNNNRPIMVPNPEGRGMKELQITRSVPKRVGKTLRDNGGRR